LIASLLFTHSLQMKRIIVDTKSLMEESLSETLHENLQKQTVPSDSDEDSERIFTIPWKV
jgi:hypothetical protein